MRTLAVIDASGVFGLNIHQVNYSKAFIPPLVVAELKCENSRNLFSLHEYNIEVREPQPNFLKEAQETALQLGYSALSLPDIHVAALTLEISREVNSAFSTWITPDIQPDSEVVCITRDRTLIGLLHKLGLMNFDGYTKETRQFLQRCYTCTKIYKDTTQIDFCKHCGHKTVTRVAYSEENGQIKLHLSSNYVHKETKLTYRGKEIKCQDQKEYRWYRASQRKEAKQERQQTKALLDEQQGWTIE
ncbi:hypothetical protein NEHOM01_2173 [Nematocida homosporus]|uniref:uncharacterized protein n=1 Tax=Nematocida homosporus TaxID=1912981 RepID=UPI00221F1733|nr:uncharacterized protein NEHOM01_2173 [Nematocida homosporus]KAI5187431.1 hypothetical protein NEHOM01_2173 [Nematocida homosporus]